MKLGSLGLNLLVTVCSSTGCFSRAAAHVVCALRFVKSFGFAVCMVISWKNKNSSLHKSHYSRMSSCKWFGSLSQGVASPGLSCIGIFFRYVEVTGDLICVEISDVHFIRKPTIAWVFRIDWASWSMCCFTVFVTLTADIFDHDFHQYGLLLWVSFCDLNNWRGAEDI